MRLLVLGGAGMLGHKIVQSFHSSGLPVECTIRGRLSDPPVSKIPFLHEVPVYEEVDVSDLDATRKLLSDIRPEFIFNCIGIIKQRDEAKTPILSIEINALLPHLLAEWARGWHGRVVHFSTDCVFSGDRGGYGVQDKSDAEDLYGKTKFLGEVQRENALTLRTSIIGRELSHFQSLVDWFLLQNNSSVRGFTRAIYTGMTTQTMADLLMTILKNNPGLSGLYHAVSEPISKYDLLLLLRDAFALNVQVEPYADFYCDRSMLPSGLEEAVCFQTPSWPRQIQRMGQDQTPYGEWR